MSQAAYQPSTTIETPSRPVRTLIGVRATVAIASLLWILWLSLSMLQSFKNTPDEIKLAPYDDYRVLVGQMVHQDFDRFFQFSVLILGGILSLGIIKKDERLKPKDWPEIILFVCSAIFLLAAIYFSVKFGYSIEGLYWNMNGLATNHVEIVDFFRSPYFQLEYRAASQCFYGGLVSSVLFVISLCLFRRTQ